jgi:hypothetical protein
VGGSLRLIELTGGELTEINNNVKANFFERFEYFDAVQ